jgi:hypothetical protein
MKRNGSLGGRRWSCVELERFHMERLASFVLRRSQGRCDASAQGEVCQEVI